MTNRKIAVHIASKDLVDTAIATAKAFEDAGTEKKIFACKSIADEDAVAKCGIDVVVMPDECSSMSKAKNFMLKHYLDAGFTGFLHIVEDVVEAKDGLNVYMNKLESMMSSLDYSISFSTVSDKCNFIFNKMNPRITITLDDSNVVTKLGLSSKIMFTSNANTAWLAFDFS